MTIEAEVSAIGKNVQIGKNSKVVGKNVTIEDGVVIGENTLINAEEILIGFGSKIEDRCTINMPGSRTKFKMGDNCLIGGDSKILAPSFVTGDYVTLHNHALVNGYKPCNIDTISGWGRIAY